MINVTVNGPYPCWIRMTDESGTVVSIRHTELLSLENAVAEAKRQVLSKLPRRDWHEVDPKLVAQP
jgi:hypothetical protein